MTKKGGIIYEDAESIKKMTEGAKEVAYFRMTFVEEANGQRSGVVVETDGSYRELIRMVAETCESNEDVYSVLKSGVHIYEISKKHGMTASEGIGALNVVGEIVDEMNEKKETEDNKK